MKFSPNRPPRPALLLLLGFCAGLGGEALLFLHAHCAQVESLLSQDFQLLAFLDRKPEESRVRVVEERLRALEGVEGVRYVSPEDSLSALEARDPDLVKSVALLGDNPLPGAFEIQVDAEALAKLPDLVRSLESVAELGDIRYKPLQAAAVLQVRFYRRLLTLVLSLAGCLISLGAATLLWRSAPAYLSSAGQGTRGEAWKEELQGAAACAAGTAGGACSAALFAYPGAAAMLDAWPRPGFQAGLLVLGALGGWMLSLRAPSVLRRSHRHPIEGAAHEGPPSAKAAA